MRNFPLVFVLTALALPARAQLLENISLPPAGQAPNGSSWLPSSPDSISSDGRFVVFVSAASNLAPGDLNNTLDIYRLDRATGAFERASLGNAGVEPNIGAIDAAISDDGRYVVFQTGATNLVPNDSTTSYDLFRRDMLNGTTELVSVTLQGAPIDLDALRPSISSDGSRIAFVTSSSLLIPHDTNGRPDIYVRDMNLATTWRVSRLPGSFGPNQPCDAPAISGDGQFVVFESRASNFGAPPGPQHIFLAAVPTGVIEEVSVSSAGVSGDLSSRSATISHDGQRIAFLSMATNFEATGPNSRDLPYLRDRATGTTRLLARTPTGQPIASEVTSLRLSNDGTFAGMLSPSMQLTPGHVDQTADAFLVDVETLATLRASRPLVEPGEPDEPILSIGGVSDSGGQLLFTSSAHNLLASDPFDGRQDVYSYQRLVDWYFDSDGDGWGNASVHVVTQVPAPPPPGFITTFGDCDDTNAAVNPGATEVCNGLDDDCDGVVDQGPLQTYCTSGTSVAGCVPTMGWSGNPSASASSGFVLTASSLPGAKQACLIYGLSSTQVAYAFGSSSYLCIGAPRIRTRVLATGGTAASCDGTYALDWLAWMAANPTALGNPLQVGQPLFAQVWYRDAGAVLNANLSNGLQFHLCP